ncbi:hypothetical protein CEE69_28955 [Rhodopirellula bahusiensis]|uniref:Uncharacterized protein n=1 Tax=Rhodopirellula bahusiensis TaxID=2014065 RepID=A0A2G1VYE2_9BACT|nr:hypothetical protein CEE69_28955 [Rhodopirellula bahusiensis]
MDHQAAAWCFDGTVLQLFDRPVSARFIRQCSFNVGFVSCFDGRQFSLEGLQLFFVRKFLKHFQLGLLQLHIQCSLFDRKLFLFDLQFAQVAAVRHHADMAHSLASILQSCFCDGDVLLKGQQFRLKSSLVVFFDCDTSSCHLSSRSVRAGLRPIRILGPLVDLLLDKQGV